MKRTAITNGNGQFFDMDKAEMFRSDKYHNGHNYISKATGSQFTDEYLFLTVGGKWILNKTSMYQGSLETYELITDTDATEWFLKQNLELPETLQGKEKDYEIL